VNHVYYLRSIITSPVTVKFKTAGCVCRDQPGGTKPTRPPNAPNARKRYILRYPSRDDGPLAAAPIESVVAAARCATTHPSPWRWDIGQSSSCQNYRYIWFRVTIFTGERLIPESPVHYAWLIHTCGARLRIRLTTPLIRVVPATTRQGSSVSARNPKARRVGSIQNAHSVPIATHKERQPLLRQLSFRHLALL
jgi:hypothetical protein